MAVIDYTVVETGYGRSLTAAQQAQVTMWISDAELIIRSRLGDLNGLDQDTLKYVIREAALARLQQPDGGATSTTVAVDDGTLTRRWEGAASHEPGLHITDEWWALLTPATSPADDSAWTILPYGSARRSP